MNDNIDKLSSPASLQGYYANGGEVREAAKQFWRQAPIDPVPSQGQPTKAEIMRARLEASARNTPQMKPITLPPEVPRNVAPVARPVANAVGTLAPNSFGQMAMATQAATQVLNEPRVAAQRDDAIAGLKQKAGIPLNATPYPKLGYARGGNISGAGWAEMSTSSLPGQTPSNILADAASNDMKSFLPRLAKGGKVCKAEGGLVKGPGTGTSDSIDATVPAESFIIPADVVKTLGLDFFNRLRELADPEGRAEDAAEGQEEVDVKLSNGEFQFTPQEAKVLGVDFLNKLITGVEQESATEGKAEGEHVDRETHQLKEHYADGGYVGLINPVNEATGSIDPDALARINQVTGVTGGRQGSIPLSAQAAAAQAPQVSTRLAPDLVTGMEQGAQYTGPKPMQPSLTQKMGEAASYKPPVIDRYTGDVAQTPAWEGAGEKLANTGKNLAGKAGNIAKSIITDPTAIYGVADSVNEAALQNSIQKGTVGPMDVPRMVFSLASRAPLVIAKPLLDNTGETGSVKADEQPQIARKPAAVKLAPEAVQAVATKAEAPETKQSVKLKPPQYLEFTDSQGLLHQRLNPEWANLPENRAQDAKDDAYRKQWIAQNAAAEDRKIAEEGGQKETEATHKARNDELVKQYNQDQRYFANMNRSLDLARAAYNGNMTPGNTLPPEAIAAAMRGAEGAGQNSLGYAGLDVNQKNALTAAQAEGYNAQIKAESEAEKNRLDAANNATKNAIEQQKLEQDLYKPSPTYNDLGVQNGTRLYNTKTGMFVEQPEEAAQNKMMNNIGIADAVLANPSNYDAQHVEQVKRWLSVPANKAAYDKFKKG